MISREVYILYKLSKMKENSFTIRLFDIQYNEEAKEDSKKLHTLYLITQFEETDMQALLSSNSELDYDQFRILTYNFLIAIRYMHLTGVIHRDLKPNNVLINLHCQISLCDFGWSRTLQSETFQEEGKRRRRLTNEICSRYYRPPEIIIGYKNYDTRSDIWSYGCIVAELLKFHLLS